MRKSFQRYNALLNFTAQNLSVISYKVILKTIYAFPEDLFALFTE